MGWTGGGARRPRGAPMRRRGRARRGRSRRCARSGGSRPTPPTCRGCRCSPRRRTPGTTRTTSCADRPTPSLLGAKSSSCGLPLRSSSVLGCSPLPRRVTALWLCPRGLFIAHAVTRHAAPARLRKRGILIFGSQFSILSRFDIVITITYEII